MLLPKRASAYLLGFLLAILIVIVAWLFKALNAPELQQAIAQKHAKTSEPPLNPQLSAYDSTRSSGVFYGSTPVAIALVDAANQARADQLNAPGNTPAQDLQIVAEFMSLYRKIFGGNPTGLNEDITAAITGTANPQQPGRIFPPNSNAIRGGQLVDRWGTAFWFHPVSASKMEIRSAGPDKQLFTHDDVILAP